MVIIGERINSTRSSIGKAIVSHNSALILKEARAQLERGASFLDINCAMAVDNEPQEMDWLLSVIQSEFNDVNISIDSPNYLAIERALAVYKGKGEILINSITGEEPRIKTILPLVKKYNTKVIALTMDESGMPDTAEKRFEIAARMLERIKKEGVKAENIYFDPLIRPVSTEPTQAREFLKSIPLIRGLGDVKTVCGLSNVSFGLPDRSLVNAVFLSMALGAGLDAAILDTLDTKVTSILAASGAILGTDEYCGEYIKAFREGKLI